MGRPFLEKFADVQWEVNEDHLQLWKDGKTGYPIVDAAMRACKAKGTFSPLYVLQYLSIKRRMTDGIGWMENRVRMVSACFLVKDLMLDWRKSPATTRHVCGIADYP
jgi:deoxyribodipyrimidine photo-lyase